MMVRLSGRGPVSVLRSIAVLAAMALLSLAPTAVPAQIGPQLSPRDQMGLPPTRTPTMWDRQPALIARSLARIPDRAVDRLNIYALAIAPIARQHLFSREARAVLRALAENYGGTASGGILLSNAAIDTREAPLATQDNIAHILAELGRRSRAAPDDVVIVYLTSHGAPDATLESGLPPNLPIPPISADSLAAALAQARIGRRVIIVSACFAGSWIPRLADDDSIVIAAAAADRTSFGCAEDRDLTYFGEAFLTGPFARGASLRDSFEGARAIVTRWEQEEKLPNSLPQVHVGKNMQAFWTAATRAPASREVAAGP